MIYFFSIQLHSQQPRLQIKLGIRFVKVCYQNRVKNTTFNSRCLANELYHTIIKAAVVMHILQGGMPR